MKVDDGFKQDLNCFVTNHKTLCILTLGLAILGFSLGNLWGRCVAYLVQVSGSAKKTNSLVQEQFKSISNFNEESTHLVKNCDSLNLLSSTSQINNFAVVKLPNYTSVHINKQGEVFYLTPIGGEDIRQYNENLDDYTKACLEISLKNAYDSEGHLINGEEIIKHSIAEKIDKLHAKEHVINLSIQACHFIIVKSDQGRYWFLHYDPGQSKHQQNQIDGLVYPRPNYSELRPVLPYNLDGVALKDDEKIQVLVIHSCRDYNIEDSNNILNGEFDSTAFRGFIGEDKVVSIKTICYKDFIEKKRNQLIEIDFNTKSESLTIYLKEQRDEPIYSTENLF